MSTSFLCLSTSFNTLVVYAAPQRRGDLHEARPRQGDPLGRRSTIRDSNRRSLQMKQARSDPPTTSDAAVGSPPVGSRLAIGGTIFVVGILSPLLIPLVAASGLPAGWKTALSGLLLVGIPELAMLAAVAVMGKSGFAWLKGRVFALIRKHGPPDQVSALRYRAGLVLFLVPLLAGWLLPYVEHLAPAYLAHKLAFAVAGDIVFVVSLFVLGGDFWDKLRGLFSQQARMQFAEGSP
jgi:hypothetical protein